MLLPLPEEINNIETLSIKKKKEHLERLIQKLKKKVIRQIKDDKNKVNVNSFWGLITSSWMALLLLDVGIFQELTGASFPSDLGLR